MAGYDESDIIQNYAGWVMFRNSDWSFPLGTASNMAVGDGTVISFTDSIPYMAIFFKIFRKWLPETFQYLGLYSLLCYILQAVSSGKLLFYKTKDYFYTFAGTVLFCFSPILLDRAFRHTALGSHWIVIFAIMFYMKHKDNYNFKYYVYFLILEMLSVGIHPYFLPMAAIFSLMCVITDLRRNKFYPVFYFLAQLVITYFTGCIIGVLGSKIEISRFGYGYFSMNINAVVNPASCGGYTWSNFIKIKPQILGNYDGFNYIGFGMLISVLILILLIIIFNSWKSLKELIKKEWLVLIICFFLVLFSVSNVVTYNDKELFTIQLPEFLLKLCGIFRASSRLFYPVYYLFFLFIFVSLWQYRIHLEKKQIYQIIILIVFLQIFDMRTCILQKHQNMELNSKYNSIIDDKNLKRLSKNKDALLLDNFTGDNRSLTVWAGKNGIDTYYSIANSGKYDETLILSSNIIQMIKSSGNISGYIIATSDPGILDEYISFPDITYYKYDDFWLILKDS